MLQGATAKAEKFLLDVDAEFKTATAKHGRFNSAHEGYAVILEELDEVWDEVKLREHNPAAMYLELKQVAAMATRMAVDIIGVSVFCFGCLDRGCSDCGTGRPPCRACGGLGGGNVYGAPCPACGALRAGVGG